MDRRGCKFVCSTDVEHIWPNIHKFSKSYRKNKELSSLLMAALFIRLRSYTFFDLWIIARPWTGWPWDSISSFREAFLLALR